VFAIGLAIGEAIINSSQDHWQFAPMWIIDYLIVVYLLAGFWVTRLGRNVAVLMSAYALSTGVMYMAFFVGLDPEQPGPPAPGGILALLGLVLGVSVLGLVASTLAWYTRERTRPA
jgi:peptidoglycan/LPS O-acetylase OafA/YrhL